jgi:hypothetical protein
LAPRTVRPPERGDPAEAQDLRGTVKRHLANLYAKIEVGSRGEVTRRALSEGWITTRDPAREVERDSRASDSPRSRA